MSRTILHVNNANLEPSVLEVERNGLIGIIFLPNLQPIVLLPTRRNIVVLGA